MNELTERAQAYFAKAHQLAPIIREHADRAEREAQMAREVADAFHEAGMFRILLPRQMGGGVALCQHSTAAAAVASLSHRENERGEASSLRASGVFGFALLDECARTLIDVTRANA